MLLVERDTLRPATRRRHNIAVLGVTQPERLPCRPRVMATARSLAIGLLHFLSWDSITAATEHKAANRAEARVCNLNGSVAHNKFVVCDRAKILPEPSF